MFNCGLSGNKTSEKQGQREQSGFGLQHSASARLNVILDRSYNLFKTLDGFMSTTFCLARILLRFFFHFDTR